jgi:diguanylate cyclase (GGDEF)-like protein
MPRLSFRQKVVFLAVMLVIGMQLVTLSSVLDLIKRDSEAKAGRQVELAGMVFDEFSGNRSDQLLTAASVLVADYGFREAAATGDAATIRSALANHSARIGADMAVLLDLSGKVIASTLDLGSDAESVELSEQANTSIEDGARSVTYVNGEAFQTVDVVVRTPLPVAHVLLGYRIDRDLVDHIVSLTGLEVTFLRSDDPYPSAVASSLDGSKMSVALEEMRGAMRRDVTPASRGGFDPEARYLTSLRPFLSGQPDLLAVLQLSMDEAIASYRDTRLVLLIIAFVAVTVAVVGAFFVGGMVTKPVERLTAAVRRMREGVYSEVVESSSDDELGELAAGFNAMQFAIAEREQQIYFAAHHDSLTGLPNRELILDKLRERIVAGTAFEVASIAVSEFNKLVASLGHETSDNVMLGVTRLLRACVGSNHIVGHLQANEFVVLVDSTAEKTASQHIEEIGRQLQYGIRVEGASFSLQLRGGIARFPEHSDNPAGLLYRAAIARMEADVAHERYAEYRAGQEDRAKRRTRLIGEFPTAVEQGQLEVFFQPKIACQSLAVRGAEALVRWRHPELGLLSPYEFVSAIEQAGSISHLTRWMLQAALQECRAWRDAGIAIGVAVNLSADDLLDEYLPYHLLDLTSKHRIPPADVTLEVTESAIMHNLAKALTVVHCIHELGFRLSIDDFGTGHSSLAQLRRLPVDELKVDRSFVQNMSDPKDAAIVRATIDLGRSLGLDVCVEGIEDLGLLATIDAMGAAYCQGYAIAKPLPRQEFTQWCARWRPAAEARAPASAPRAVV